MNPVDTTNLQQLIDRAAIQDVLLRYARGVDRRDWELVRSAYHPDAVDLHGDFNGGVDDLIEFIQTRHKDGGQAMHFLGNCLIEFFGPESALVETYFSSRRIGPYEAGAFQKLAENSETADLDVLGRYIDHFVKRTGEWRIARRVVAFEAVRRVAVRVAKISPDWAWSHRDDSDPIYKMRKEIARSNQRRQNT